MLVDCLLIDPKLYCTMLSLILTSDYKPREYYFCSSDFMKSKKELKGGL